MGLFGKKDKNKEKGVPFWKRNKQKQEEELVQEELPEQELSEEAPEALQEPEEDIAAAAIREQEAQEQDEVERLV